MRPHSGWKILLPSVSMLPTWVVVMVPWPAFHEIPALLRAMPPRPFIVLDCWRLLEPAGLDGLADLVHIGKASPRE